MNHKAIQYRDEGVTWQPCIEEEKFSVSGEWREEGVTRTDNVC